MCFSEKLIEKAAAYQEDSGYVLVGYKCVLQIGEWLLPWNSVSRACDVIVYDDTLKEGLATRTDLTRPHRTIFHLGFKIATRLLQEALSSGHPIFEPRTLLCVKAGDHPFHVGANQESVCANSNANPFGLEAYAEPMGVKCRPSPKTLPKATEVMVKNRPKPPGVLVRVLVPENAVDCTNHVHAMMIIPPGHIETERDIAKCEEYNRTHPCLSDTNWRERDYRRELYSQVVNDATKNTYMLGRMLKGRQAQPLDLNKFS